MATDLTVANTIRAQLGSTTMNLLGAKNLVGDEHSLMFQIQGSANYNKIRITLTPQDDYTVEFIKLGKAPNFDIKAHDTHEGIYVDQLHELIERHTGLYTRIGR